MTVFVLWLRTADAERRSSQCAAGQRVGVGGHCLERGRMETELSSDSRLLLSFMLLMDSALLHSSLLLSLDQARP